MIAFLVVGHNEVSTLRHALLEAVHAATTDDEVIFVDSASTDGSADVADSLGVPRLSAPLGKGAAMRAAIEAARQPWLVFLDADLVGSERNIADTLATSVRGADPAGLILGDFEDKHPGILSSTWGIYRPLVGRLFPEVKDEAVSKPLTGFRAVRSEWVSDVGALPDDFGVEARLNIDAWLAESRRLDNAARMVRGSVSLQARHGLGNRHSHSRRSDPARADHARGAAGMGGLAQDGRRGDRFVPRIRGRAPCIRSAPSGRVHSSPCPRRRPPI